MSACPLIAVTLNQIQRLKLALALGPQRNRPSSLHQTEQVQLSSLSSTFLSVIS